VGTTVRVKEGVVVPEYPEFSCAGWTGSVVELSGKKKNPKYIIEWDEKTLGEIPDEYREKCEEAGMYFRMACLMGNELESLASSP